METILIIGLVFVVILQILILIKIHTLEITREIHVQTAAREPDLLAPILLGIAAVILIHKIKNRHVS